MRNKTKQKTHDSLCRLLSETRLELNFLHTDTHTLALDNSLGGYLGRRTEGQGAGRALTFGNFPKKWISGPKKCTYRKYVKGGRKIRVMLHFRENPGLWWGIYGKMDKILVT